MDQKREKTELPERIYSAERKSGILQAFRSLVKDFPAANALGFRFAERSIRAKYRQSALGFFWALFPPLATAAIWIILQKSAVVSFQVSGVPYPLFVVVGTMLWAVFSNAILLPIQTVQANRAILTKVNFPREALLINAFYEILFNALVILVIIAAALLLFRADLSLQSLLFIPAMLLLIFLGMSLGMLLMPIAMLYKDVQFALPTALQFIMYLTPVVYAKPIYQGAGKILDFNPVTPVLTNARSWLLGLETFVPAWQIGLVTGGVVLLLLGGFIFQRITIGILIERMGS